jgi:hypothetical protein
MSTMSQPIQAVENIVPLTHPQPAGTSNRFTGFRRLASLRLLASLIVLPLLLVAAALSFLVILADFAFFRLRDLRNGHPQPKGLWEF